MLLKMKNVDEILLSESVFVFANKVEEKYRDYMKNCPAEKKNELNKRLDKIIVIGRDGQYSSDIDELNSMYNKLMEYSIELDFFDGRPTAYDNTSF